MIRIQRHIRTTGRRHRIHPHDQIQRTPHPQRHQRFRPHTLPDQPPRQPPHPPRELGIGQTRPLERDRERLRTPRHLRLEQRHQRRYGRAGQGRGEVAGGGVPIGQQSAAFAGVQQVDIADGGGRIGHHGRQQPDQAPRQCGHRGGVEKIGGVDEFGEHAGRVRTGGRLRQHQLQIELRGIHRQFDGSDRQSGQFQGGLFDVLEGQHHLEQGMPGARADRVEDLDHSLERQVCVLEGGEVGGADRAQQGAERLRAGHFGAQDHGVDEHADQIVERPVPTTGDRSSDHDVAAAGHPGEQRREGRVHHHEQAGAVRGGERGGRFHDRRVDREAVHGTAIRGDGGPGAVEGEAEFGGEVREFPCPVRDPAGGEGFGVLFGAENFTLPDGVVRVLHREGSPAGFGAGQASGVGGHHIPHHGAQRETVGADVVHHEHHQVPMRVAVDPQQAGAHRDLGGDVERGVHHLVQSRRKVGLDHRLRDEIEIDFRHREHPLTAGTTVFRVDRAQRLVARDDVPHGGGEGGEVEGAGEPQHQRYILGGAVAVEPVQEPDPLLRRRQRQQRCDLAVGQSDRGRAWPGGERNPGGERGFRFEPGGERRDGRRLEQPPHRYIDGEDGAEPARDPGGDQRIAAESEEVVVAADPVQAEHLGDGRRHGPLGHRLGGPEHGGREGGCGQRRPVQFAGRSAGDPIEHGDHGRHHVPGQPVCGECGEGRYVDRSILGGNDIRDQRGGSGRLLVADGDGEGDGVVRGQRRIDLTEFHPEAAHLHLEVAAAEVFEFAVARPANEIARAVEAFAGAVRVGDETRRGQAGPAVVPACELDAGQVQLTGYPFGDGP
ncbi:hypothetical protein NRB56_76140 [Nocardia sp. RB56]|uniref:Uncharacterized protein n=1 Tax=Nocardia aurantia TaxID=2585199 RepID=A0A7K0E1N0_9NOCA|nr:hypothetical protein [Nocardia aurantia]